MIEDHDGHVNTIRHADRVLQGMGGWDPLPADAEKSGSTSSKAAQLRDQAALPASAKQTKARRIKPR
ncbi:hypothetical protein [Rhodospirillum sp. A1_3_36]|uniref:hypothetical protein n=1 Tax=Rhodospirillum sp. A1_3_36 TaxID=3391666 RepID=UPI0039A402AD